MDNRKYEVLGGGVHQLNNKYNYLPFDLQLFALEYNKVDNPYEHTLVKNTYAKGDIKVVYDLAEYYKKIPNHSTITELPEENADYIKEALPNVTDCGSMMGNSVFGYDGCESLKSIDTTGWDTSNVTYMAYMFSYCKSLTTLDASNFNTSKVTSMSWMFHYCQALTALDLSKWDTSNVTSMIGMFKFCQALTTIGDVSNLDTSKVTNMGNMFNSCNALTALDVSKWDTSKVTSMYDMFHYCQALTALDLSNWNTSNVTDMNGMFGNCYNLTSLDVSNWNTSKVTNMSNMFQYCYKLTTITGVIDMKSCTDYNGMFSGCTKLSGVKIKNPPSNVTATSGIGGLAAGKYEIVS